MREMHVKKRFNTKITKITKKREEFLIFLILLGDLGVGLFVSDECASVTA